MSVLRYRCTYLFATKYKSSRTWTNIMDLVESWNLLSFVLNHFCFLNHKMQIHLVAVIPIAIILVLKFANINMIHFKNV